LGLKRVISLAAAVALWIAGTGIVYADSLAIDFEQPAYVLGSIDGQPFGNPQHWQGQTPPEIPINKLIDQEIVHNGPTAPESFGPQSWRISNAYTSGTFGDMPFSPSLKNEAGETMALNGNGAVTFSGGTRQNHFDVKWAFASADPTGPGTDCGTGVGIPCSYLSMSPDRGDGARMSYIRLEDDTSGLRVFFDDYQDKAPYGAEGSSASALQGCSPNDDFVETMVASGLARNEPHTVQLSMDFVDGPRNDVVNVFVDGKHVHTGTSWEDYFRWCTESNPTAGNNPATDQSRTVDSMIFRVGGSQGENHPLNRGKGFLIDNLSYASFNTDQCNEHNSDGDSDVQSASGGHSHGKFHKHGCGKDATDSVSHQDDQQGHSFQSTSVDAAAFTTAADGRTATMTGTGLDNGLPVTFTLVVVDHDGLIPATYSLVLSDGYAFIGTVVSGSISVL
jgi:hypothetical protein